MKTYRVTLLVYDSDDSTPADVVRGVKDAVDEYFPRDDPSAEEGCFDVHALEERVLDR